MLTEFEEDY